MNLLLSKLNFKLDVKWIDWYFCFWIAYQFCFYIVELKKNISEFCLICTICWHVTAILLRFGLVLVALQTCLLFFVPFGSIDDETTNLQKVFYTFLCSLSSKFVSIKNMYADFFVLLNSSLTNFKNTNIEEICKGANTFIQNCVCLFFSFSKVQCIFVSVTNS